MRSSMRTPLSSIAVLPVTLALGLFVACGGASQEPKAAAPGPFTSVAAPPPSANTPACSDGPANPAEEIAKEPALFNACFAAAKLDPNLCGQAKIAVEIGKDGRVTRAEVASSTLPQGVTDCLKARLSAARYACPKEGTGTYTVPFGLPIGSPTGACPGLPAAPAPAP